MPDPPVPRRMGDHNRDDVVASLETCDEPARRRCSRCGEDRQPLARYCHLCGAWFGGSLASVTADAAPDADAERRHLTVMFCDLVGSTSLAERLDPEELREVILAYQGVCARAIRRYDGYLAQYVGDGVLAYFGYPVAHEDDAKGAICAGLQIIEDMARSDVAAERKLAVRVGIDSGLVVAGEMGAPGNEVQLAIVGETPNIAARLQALAPPDAVVISASTHRLTRGFFDCQSLGPCSIRGISSPLEVYRVRGETGAQSRLEIAVGTGLTPLVGRSDEVELLTECWNEARNGTGRVVLVAGEAGIGKSRLLHELKDTVAATPSICLECRCSPYHQDSALYPIVDVLLRVWHLKGPDSPQEKVTRLERVVARFHHAPPETVPLLAALLSLPVPDRYPALGLTPQAQKQKTLEALRAILLEMAAEQPVLFVVEDLHWIDASSLELLTLLVERAAAVRILAVFLFRQTFRPPWDEPTMTGISLGRLTADDSTRMIQLVAGGKALSPDVLREIGAKADGIPLYIEELTKTVLESGLLEESCGPRAFPALAIPETLQESLLARLDRLAPTKEVVQLGATLGRAFPYSVLQAVSPIDETKLRRELARLVEAEILHVRGEPPQATYVFKHALIQDAAYESLLRSKRREYHRRIAETFQRVFPEVPEAQPELMAHHYAAAGLPREAAVYCERAGQRAIARSGHVEAVSHLSRGLDLLGGLPPSDETARQELDLCTALGVALMASKGYAAPEVEQVYARARALCERLGAQNELFTALWGLGAFHQARAKLETALALAQERLLLADRLQDPGLLLQAHEAAGTVSFWRGEFASALAYLERGIALYDFERHRSLCLVYGQDSGVVCRAYGGLVLWYLGYHDRAVRMMADALELARQVGHPYSLALAMDFTAGLHQNRRDPAASLAMAERAITLSTEQQFPFWLGFGFIMRGWSLAAQGRGDEAIKQLLDGMLTYQGTGAQLGSRYTLAILAEAFAFAGKFDDGLNVFTTALAALENNEDRFWDAEVRRVQGDLLLARSPDDHAAAEACYLKALATAREQQAKSLEIRAATSLGRLWRTQGHTDRARGLVATTYDWFTEGFDSPDLKDARALLDALA